MFTATEKQVAYLVSNCGYEEGVAKALDRAAASAVIGADVEKRVSSPATQKQLAALANLGVSKKFSALKSREASMLITVLSALMGIDVAKTNEARNQALLKMEQDLRVAFKQQPTVQ